MAAEGQHVDHSTAFVEGRRRVLPCGPRARRALLALELALLALLLVLALLARTGPSTREAARGAAWGGQSRWERPPRAHDVVQAVGGSLR